MKSKFFLQTKSLIKNMGAVPLVDLSSKISDFLAKDIDRICGF
jgi:hypothetical protein